MFLKEIHSHTSFADAKHYLYIYLWSWFLSVYIDILVQPDSRLDVVPGQDAVFSVNASGDGLTYQWQRESVNLTDSVQYSGSNTSSLTVLSVAEDDEGDYTCVVTASDGNSTTTDVAQLAVRECCVEVSFRVDCVHVLFAGDPPIIVTQPDSEFTGFAGSDVDFMVSATGTALTYQWQRNEIDLVDTPSELSGTTTFQLSVLNVEENDEGSYRCVVSNGNTPASDAIYGPIQLTVCKFAIVT